MHPDSWAAAVERLQALNAAAHLPTAAGPQEPEEFRHQWLEALGDSEPRERAAVSAAVLQLASGSPLPPLSPTQAALLALRFHFGQGLGYALEAAEEDSTKTDVPSFAGPATAEGKLRWLLLDAWELLGQHQWESLGYWFGDWRPPEM